MKYLYIYGNIALPANTITAVLGYAAWTENLGALVWVKVISFSILAAYVYIFKPDVIIFFMNLGVSKLRFYSSMFFIDISIFVLLISLILIIK